MSHFAVWVLGPDPEKQLAPYDENIEVDPYRDYIEGEDLALMAKHYGTTDLAALAANMEDWHGQPGGVDEQGLYSVSTYNSKSRWDWCVLGGRWLGSLVLKAKVGASGRTSIGRPGVFDNTPRHLGGVDAARKGAIDFEAMEAGARQESESYYSELELAVAGKPPAQTWKECQEAYPNNIEGARTVYHNQPAVAAIEAARLDEWDGDPVSHLRLGRDAYVSRRMQHSWVPRVLVRDGEWNEVGRMGWFGLSADDPDDFDAWAAEVRSVVLNLPDDTLISVMDCHI